MSSPEDSPSETAMAADDAAIAAVVHGDVPTDRLGAFLALCRSTVAAVPLPPGPDIDVAVSRVNESRRCNTPDPVE